MREKRQYGKPPSPPKKALSSFLLFRAQMFEQVKKNNPGVKITDLTTLISQMWSQADSATKHRLQTEHEKNKRITEFQRQEYEKKYGHSERKRKQKRKKREFEHRRHFGSSMGT